MSSPNFSGSLINKRKADLVEIANALGLPEVDTKMTELREAIQARLDAQESTLKDSPVFKGLYASRRKPNHVESESESPATNSNTSPDIKNALANAATKGRKSINKVADRVQATVEAANIPLPDSPAVVARVQEVASQSLALVPQPEIISKDLTFRFNSASGALMKFQRDNMLRVEQSVRVLRDALSKPESVIGAALALEAIFLFAHVVQWYDHTIFFPPMAGEKGSISSLIHGIFFWAPNWNVTVRLPDIHSFGVHSKIWQSLSWWFCSTVLPPLALSTVVSFVPQKGVRTGHATRYQAAHPPIPSVDPLTFSFFRLAALLFPLTSAAPSALVDALALSGDAQGRALMAGLVAALVVAERLAA